MKKRQQSQVSESDEDQVTKKNVPFHYFLYDEVMIVF
jgi:hypothetical protein